MARFRGLLLAGLCFFALSAMEGCPNNAEDNTNDEGGETFAPNPDSPGFTPVGDRLVGAGSNRFLIELQFISPFETDICPDGEGGTAVAVIFETVFNGLFEPQFGEFITNDADEDGRADDVTCFEPALPLAPRTAV